MDTFDKRYLLPPKTDNPIVFFDISIGGQNSGRILIELFKDACPGVVEGFRKLCTGEALLNSEPCGYKNSTFYRVINGFMIQGGDFINQNGSGCYKLCEGKMPEIITALKHDCCGLLSIENKGVNTNACQFIITCASAPWLDENHIVFGRVIHGMDIVKIIEAIQISLSSKAPVKTVIITQCGEI